MAVAATLDNTLGALFIGIFLSAILYGIEVAQVYHYLYRFKNDHVMIRVVISLVMMSETAHLAMLSSAFYNWGISNFGDFTNLENVPLPLIIQVIFTGITAFLVELFFAWRIWRLSGKNMVLVIVVVCAVVVQFASSISYVTANLTFIHDRPSATTEYELTQRVLEYAAHARPWTIFLDASQAVADVLISGVLVKLLWGSRTEFSKTNGLINRLIIFSVNTGLVTSVCAIIALILYNAMSSTLIYVLFYSLVGRLYTNSLLATLNVRASIREDASKSHISFSLEERENRNAPGGGLSVQIHTLKEVDTESQTPSGASKPRLSRDYS